MKSNFVADTRKKILIIEDEIETRNFLSGMLSKEFQVIVTEDASLGMNYIIHKEPDLILLDWILPGGMSGLELLEQLKKSEKIKDIPVIFLTVQSGVSFSKKALALGADDYLTKPFDFSELLERIRVRLHKKVKNPAPKELDVAGIRINLVTREVIFDGASVELTITEFDLLCHFVKHPGQVISRKEIFKEVWKSQVTEVGSDRTIDVHVRSLRKKMPGLVKHLVSEYGQGYKFEV